MLSTSIRRILIASGFTVATSFMTVLSASATVTANSNAGFTGTVEPSCATTGFPNLTGTGTKKVYTSDPYASSGSGGVLKLSANQNAVFNCNTTSVDVSTAVVLTKPTPPSGVPGSFLVVVHKTTVTGANNVDNSLNRTTASSPTATLTDTGWDTDGQGNISINVASEWNPATTSGTLGQELLAGTYTAVATVTVTPR